MKKFVSMLLAITMLVAMIPVQVSAAYEPQYEYEAQMLYEMGLFRGTDKGFELGKTCTRLEAAALFVRLLGKEQEALSNPKKHPFTDVPAWASPYIGQMYYDGYTKGISANKYGTGNVTANQFATFCLRALGYSEDSYGEAYFAYEQALEKMLQQYILRQDSYDTIKNAKVFMRDYAVKMAYNSLFTPNDKGFFLIRKLSEEGIIDIEFLKTRDIFIEDNIRYLYSVESFKPYFENMIREAAEGNKIVSVVSKHERGLKGGLNNLNPQSILRQELLYETGSCDPIVQKTVMADDLTSEWTSGHDFYTRTIVDPTEVGETTVYRCIRYMNYGDVKLTDKEEKIIAKTKQFLSTITDDMSDYDKFKAAYDFVAENIEYEMGLGNGNLIAGLADGKGICGAFAESYLYLCRLMGLECWEVGGTVSGVGHAWNKVKLNGKYYNVDPTGRSSNYFLFKDLPNRVVDETLKIYDFPCNEDYNH